MVALLTHFASGVGRRSAALPPTALNHGTGAANVLYVTGISGFIHEKGMTAPAGA